MITIAERIEVASPPEDVWKVLADPEALVSCIGGAELGERYPDDSFDAALAVKFGGLRVAFNARATLELEDEQMQGRFSARGADRQGATRVSTEANFKVESVEQGPGSVVTIGGEVKLSGKLASVIDAGAGVVIARMTREFAASLTARSELDGAAPAVVATAGDEESAAGVSTYAGGGGSRAGGRWARLWAALVGIVRPSTRAKPTVGSATGESSLRPGRR